MVWRVLRSISIWVLLPETQLILSDRVVVPQGSRSLITMFITIAIRIFEKSNFRPLVSNSLTNQLSQPHFVVSNEILFQVSTVDSIISLRNSSFLTLSCMEIGQILKQQRRWGRNQKIVTCPN